MNNDDILLQDHEEFRDSIATVDKQGKRIWLYPKMPSGRFYNWRKMLSYVLLLVLFVTPWIKIGGKPFLMFNILERKFIIFGALFTPQDFHLALLAILTGIIFIALFTVIFGRIFCGWICPQTIFMEMLFRRIEYWIEGDWKDQKRLNDGPWNSTKIWKKTLKTAIFYFISVLIANTFLAYIIGSDEVIKIATEPIGQHWKGFVALLIFSFVFYGVFAWMREQVCIAVCPYGRLQGVLLDNNSVVVHYDFERGEPRGKLKKANSAAKSTNLLDDMAKTATQGDCIDCKLCIHVCPTGIDIRNGTQLECVNCTACIDACDEVMDKIEKPRGLIRYDSYNGIKEGRKTWWNPRAMAYSAVLILLVGLEVFLIASRTEVETLVLRAKGQLYQKIDENTYSNLYNYQIVNKTTKDLTNIEFKLKEGKLIMTTAVGTVPAEGKTGGSLRIELKRDQLSGQEHKVVVEIWENGKKIDEVKTTFVGPITFN